MRVSHVWTTPGGGAARLALLTALLALAAATALVLHSGSAAANPDRPDYRVRMQFYSPDGVLVTCDGWKKPVYQQYFYMVDWTCSEADSTDEIKFRTEWPITIPEMKKQYAYEKVQEEADDDGDELEERPPCDPESDPAHSSDDGGMSDTDYANSLAWGDDRYSSQRDPYDPYAR